MRILAATDFSTRSNRAVRQAGLLAQGADAELHIIHVVDDDRPSRMQEIERREATQILSEQIRAMPELLGIRCRPLVVAGNPFDGILRTAVATKPDLVVMGQHRRRLLRDFFVGTTIERVVRAGPFPVLMVNNEAQKRYERPLVAVDMSDTSALAISVARKTGLLGALPTAVHAFEAPAKGKMKIADANPVLIADYVARERSQASAELLEFLASAGGGVGEQWSMLVEEGQPNDVLPRAAREMRSDLLIMGTRGRSKPLTALVGSVTQECLRSLDVDVLAVPPA